MRIIGGTAGSRRLKAPTGQGTRPTSDRVRESVFSILGPPPPDARVLDLFAGAGTLGLEALSRGAAAAVFVERAPAALSCLRDNIDSLGMTSDAEVIAAEVARALDRLARRGARFDWIFVDPPYHTELALATLATLAEGDLVADAGIVVVEHDKRRPLPETVGALAREDQRTYGDTLVAFYGRVSP